MNPLVSILIPTCNRPLYFEQALKSAVTQTYPNLEIVICDNSSNTLTEQIVQRYKAAYPHRNIKYVRNPKNIGPIANQQKCLQLASGEYINYLMDDDLFHPKKIEKMMNYLLRNNSIALVTSQRRVIDEKGKQIYVPPVWTFKKLFSQDTILDGRTFTKILLQDKTNYIGEPTTVLFRKKFLKEPFGVLMGKQVYFAVDLATWLNLLQYGKGVYMIQPLSYLRYHPQQLSQHKDADKIKKLDRETFVRFAKKNGYIRGKVK